MITITEPKIEKYLMKLSREADRHILEMERIAKQRDFPIVDRLVGRLLFVLTKLKNPKLIVELGSGFGYSAYWFARALEKGRVVLIDTLQDNIDYAKKTFQQARLAHKAEFRVGNAIERAKDYNNIDILFIDIDKHQYLEAVQKLLANLNDNALIIADNSLWHGRVVGKKRDRDTVGIRKFNEYLFSHRDFFTTVLPLRDGVLVAYKLS
ncbi:MAG TPA: O-methyltransferase [Nitrospiraceae bacterium]|nr:O-methyltransferase [Nitrospiraceae bacterium]